MISEGGPGPFLVQALYSFKGQNNDELEFKKGDIITVCQAEEGGWWEGTLNGDTGWFPSNYVNRYTPPENSRANGDPAGGRQVMNQQQVYRNQVLKELLESEETHVQQLSSLQSCVLRKLETSSLLLDSEFSQLVGNFDQLVTLHEELLETLKCVREKSLIEQRIGKLFLDFAPNVKEKLLQYCSNHPRAVLVLEKYKSELNAYVEGVKEGSEPGILYLTTGLSRPFRRLEKYAGMLQELSRHLDDGHPDRGDTLRVATVYTDIAGACSNMRRQKELELEVLTGRVDGWREGANLSSLGSILKMGQVNILSEDLQPHDRYLVLFPHTLLLLSVTKCSSAFLFEGKMEMPGLSIREVEDTETNKNCFDVNKGEDHWLISCHSREDFNSWFSELQQENAKPASPSPPKVSGGPPPPYTDLTRYLRELYNEYGLTKERLRNIIRHGSYLPVEGILTEPEKRRYKVECVFVPGTVAKRPDSDPPSTELGDSGYERASGNNPFGYIRYMPTFDSTGSRADSPVGDNQYYADDESETPAPRVAYSFRASEDVFYYDEEAAKQLLCPDPAPRIFNTPASSVEDRKSGNGSTLPSEPSLDKDSVVTCRRLSVNSEDEYTMKGASGHESLRKWRATPHSAVRDILMHRLASEEEPYMVVPVKESGVVNTLPRERKKSVSEAHFLTHSQSLPAISRPNWQCSTLNIPTVRVPIGLHKELSGDKDEDFSGLLLILPSEELSQSTKDLSSKEVKDTRESYQHHYVELSLNLDSRAVAQADNPSQRSSDSGLADLSLAESPLQEPYFTTNTVSRDSKTMAEKLQKRQAESKRRRRHPSHRGNTATVLSSGGSLASFKNLSCVLSTPPSTSAETTSLLSDNIFQSSVDSFSLTSSCFDIPSTTSSQTESSFTSTTGSRRSFSSGLYAHWWKHTHVPHTVRGTSRRLSRSVEHISSWPRSSERPLEVFPPALPPHRSLVGNVNSIESASKSSLLAGGAPSRGTVLCLRPSPPTRFFCSQDVVAKKKYKRSDWKPGVEYPQVLIAEEEKIFVEETDGDGAVLQEKSLVDTVYALRDDLSDLRKDVSHLKVELEEERASRKKLEMMLVALQSHEE